MSNFQFICMHKLPNLTFKERLVFGRTSDSGLYLNFKVFKVSVFKMLKFSAKKTNAIAITDHWSAYIGDPIESKRKHSVESSV